MKTFATCPRPEPLQTRTCALCGASSFQPLWRLDSFAFVRCRQCGLVQQNPQPLPEAVRARYDEAYLAYEEARQFLYRDLELHALTDLGFGAAAASLRRQAAVEGHGPRILDVGCATGALLVSLREEGWICRGLEICLPSANYGRERYGLDIETRPLEEVGFPSASFEAVHASHLIEHLNDPRNFLREVGRILVPGGLLVLTTPNSAGLQARVRGGAWRSAIYDHLYLFSVTTLSRLLGELGFQVEGLVTWGGWAEGLRPRFLKRPLDRLAKRYGFGDVMALLARRPPEV